MSEFSFGLKLKFGGKKFKKGHVVYLRNIEENHNKYYHIILQDHPTDEFPYWIRIEFGKINSSGNFKHHKFKNQAEALAFVGKITQQKLNKGYKNYTPSKTK